jgi:hypothetical protein
MTCADVAAVHGPSQQGKCRPESCWTGSTWKELKYVEACICNVKPMDDFPSCPRRMYEDLKNATLLYFTFQFMNLFSPGAAA